jgi:hypothetical protein
LVDVDRKANVALSLLPLGTLLGVLAVATSSSAFAQDRNLLLPVSELEPMLRSEPLRIVSAEISRPKARGDITLKADVAFGERPPLRVKLRNAVPGAQEFNNVPRYDIAAPSLWRRRRIYDRMPACGARAERYKWGSRATR